MNAFSIGSSAIAASTRALDLIGQNIANASTPGYSRQRVDLANTTVGDQVGTGVTITRFTRYEAPTLQTALNAGGSGIAALNARLVSRQQVQTALSSTTGGISDQLSNFFAQVAGLTANPTDPTSRRQVLATTDALAKQFNATAASLDYQRADVGRQADQVLTEVNQYATQIAELNGKIAIATAQGYQPNDLLDQRDQLIANLSDRINIRTVPQNFGVVNVIADGSPVVVGDTAVQFDASTTATGQKQIVARNTTTPLSFSGGRLSGLLQEYNTDIPATRSRLDTLAAKFIQQVDQVQATGLPLTGPKTVATASRGVTDPTQFLSTQNLPIPVQAGNLVISVTNSGTGARTNSVVAINPATQSLNAIAAAVTAATGGQVQATVDTPSNTLRFQAQAGFSFDFAARPSNPPQAVAIGGTAVPTVGGAYTGAADDTYTFQITGTGTIGQTAGLSLEVRNAANQVVATANVGSGYTPGNPISAGNGITVQLSAGTTTNGSFTSALYAQPDSAGALAAFGLNGVFSGSSATDIAVRPELLADPSQLALSRTGQPGDSGNAKKFAAIADTNYFGTRTIGLEFTDIAGQVGAQVRALTDQTSAQSGVNQSLAAQQQGIVGVDVNEETLQLLNYSRMTQAASRYISVVNTALDSILDIVR